MSDKTKLPPTSKNRQQRLLDVINAPPSRAMVDLINPNSPASAEKLENHKAVIAAGPAQAHIDAMIGTDEAFIKFKAAIAPRTNTLDSLSPGESFDKLTLEEIIKKPALNEMDILMAPPSDKILNALKVGVLTNKDGSDQLFLTGKSLDNYVLKGGIPSIPNFRIVPFDQLQKSIAGKYLGMIAETPPGHLNPKLVARMAIDPQVEDYANYAIEKANARGLNGNMIANQLWAESRFNPKAISGAGALGIGQIMPYHQGKYGLGSRSDFFDGYKSIDGAIAMMGDLTDKLKDQRLATIAYNGGEGSIRFVEKGLGKPQISYEDWHGFMENRRSQYPSDKPSAWQNETYNYVRGIAGNPTPTERPKLPTLEPIAPEPGR